VRYTQPVAGYVYVVIIVGWTAWMIPFFLIRRSKGRTENTTPQIDRRARWGIVLQVIAYSILWQNSFWARTPPHLWRLVPGTTFLFLGDLLSWTSARTLGKQWRFDAGLNADHQLVQSGAYRLVRHPIYTSMLCVMIGTGSLITPVPVLAVAVTLFAIGTEIRVRIEDALLASRFGDRFDAYRQRVAAYIPFVY
jgi:protein-S-isoprenylcysteine O-methyltransferase Ste14